MAERWEMPIATVDVAIFTLVEDRLAVVLAIRDKEPFDGEPALPGVFIHPKKDRDLRDAAKRALQTKLGFVPSYLEQLKTVGSSVRDPRGWSLSVAYLAVTPLEQLQANISKDIEILPVDEIRVLPFDHMGIVETGVDRLRDQANYSSLPAFLLPEEFTFLELHDVYQKVLGIEINKSAFRRKIFDHDMLEELEGKHRGGSHRPAQLYRLRNKELSKYHRVFTEKF